jgi:sialic acid synthase SpsE/CMP-N-acetylneuraminic acid synthetase
VAGIPLVGWAVRLGRSVTRRLDGGEHAVVLSTDDPSIAEIGRSWGADAPFLRESALSTADATSADVAIDAIERLSTAGRRFDLLVLLQPTSPLQAKQDVLAAIDLAWSTGRSVTTVAQSHHATWHVDPGPDGMHLATEDFDHLLTGGCYVVAPDVLTRRQTFVEVGETLASVVPADRAIDIDEEIDLQTAESILHHRPEAVVHLGTRRIGGGAPTLVIAEAGVNHNGDTELAHRLVDAAADSGADVVKFQTFDPRSLARPGAPLADYQVAAGEHGDQVTMLERLALSAESHDQLARHAAERGIVFLSSPFDVHAADLLDGLGVDAFKVPSGELTNLPFLADLARRGRPLLVSTGMADIREVADAVDAIEAAGDPPVALFHCVSAYPAAPSDANLAAMATLRAAFGVPVGWSDHTPGIELGIAAAALGAAMIEKHLTLDRSMPGPDHAASLEPAEFARLVESIRMAGAAVGDGQKVPTSGERSVARAARRSLHWARDMASGTIVAENDLILLRPGTGLPPGRAVSLVGRRLRRPVTGSSLAAADDVDA